MSISFKQLKKYPSMTTVSARAPCTKLWNQSDEVPPPPFMKLKNGWMDGL